MHCGPAREARIAMVSDHEWLPGVRVFHVDVTFHALGRVRLVHQPHDAFPRERCMLEQMVIDDADAVIAEATS